MQQSASYQIAQKYLAGVNSWNPAAVWHIDRLCPLERACEKYVEKTRFKIKTESQKNASMDYLYALMHG